MLIKSHTNLIIAFRNRIYVARKNVNCCKRYDVKRVIKVEIISSSKSCECTFCTELVIEHLVDFSNIFKLYYDQRLED